MAYSVALHASFPQRGQKFWPVDRKACVHIMLKYDFLYNAKHIHIITARCTGFNIKELDFDAKDYAQSCKMAEI